MSSANAIPRSRNNSLPPIHVDAQPGTDVNVRRNPDGSLKIEVRTANNSGAGVAATPDAGPVRSAAPVAPTAPATEAPKVEAAAPEKKDRPFLRALARVATAGTALGASSLAYWSFLQEEPLFLAATAAAAVAGLVGFIATFFRKKK